MWAWIVVIVIGSLLLLGTIAFSIRLFIIRRRKDEFVDAFGDENLPQRRVTVRRGRIVEQSKHLSLTGSKFGLNAFNPEDDRAGARSKSPFEWWTSVKNRSQSENSHRNSQMTQITNDDFYSHPTSPEQPRIYQRHDLTYSSTSLASSTKGSDVSTSIREESEPMSPTYPVRNFSRSFSRQGSRPRALSRIEESSPHTSMISARQSNSPAFPHNNHRDTKSSIGTPLPLADRPTSRSTSQQYLPDRPTSRSNPQQNPDRPTSRDPQQYPPFQYKSRIESMTFEVSSLRSDQATVGYYGRRSSYGDSTQRLSQISSHDSLGEQSPRNSTASSAHITALPVPPIPRREQSQYWQCRTDDGELRRSSSSKRGQVLRKKSLKRAELVTKVVS